MSITASTTVDGRVVSMSGEGDFRNNAALGSMTMVIPGQGTTVSAIQKGSTMFMTSDTLRGQLPGGESWLKMDMDKIRTTTLSKYGEDVEVTVPPSWDTYDATKVTSSMFKT